MKKSLCFLILVFALGCNDEPNLNKPNPDPVSIVEANDSERLIYDKWIKSKTTNHRLVANQFISGKLYKLRNNQTSHELYSVVSPFDSGVTLSFSIVNDEIQNEFMSRVLVEENSISSEVHTFEGELMYVFRDFKNGDRITEFAFNTTSRTTSWWSAFDDCFGDLGAPFESNFANWVFGVVAEVTTVGLYYPATALVCAGVASAS